MVLNRVLMFRVVLIFSTFELVGCATKAPSPMVGAATAPLNDLNLVQVEIPRVLVDALEQPYAVPADLSCPALVSLIRELDQALGHDLDSPALASAPGLMERGATEAESAAVGAVRRTTESLLPFRSWIRKLTGAESHSKKFAAAIAAGKVRRAFIKGVGVPQHCIWYPPETNAPTASP